jgi:nucleoside-triphosphatase THEP1
MIVILTGPVNSGKTTFMKKLIPELSFRSVPVHGFLSERVKEKGTTTGYDLFSIQSQKTSPYLRTKGKEDWERIGPYYLVPETLAEAKKTINKHLLSQWLIIDEIGPLELKGKGIWPALIRVLPNADLKLLCVVRRSILHEFLNSFAPRKARILDIHETSLLAKTIKLLTELDQSPSD